MTADDTTSTIEQWLDGMRPEDLDIIEHGGRRLIPDHIKKRNAKDPTKLDIVKVLIRAPSTEDKALARLDALEWARQLAIQRGRKSVPDKYTIAEAEAVFGRAYFDELDTKCLVALCTHDVEPPHDPFMLAPMLSKHFEHGSLMDIWDRINFWYDYGDVRIRETPNEGEFIELLARLDRVRNVSPLLVFAGSVRDSLVLTMASRLRASVAPKS